MKLAKLSSIDNEAADEYSAAFMDHMVGVTIDKLRQELVVFGRIDDELPWRAPGSTASIPAASSS